MERDTKRGLLITIIVLLVIIAVALSGIFALMLFRQSNIGIDLGIDEQYPTVMERNEESKYDAYKIALIAGTVEITNSEDGKLHYSIQADEKKLSVSEDNGTLVIIDKSDSKKRIKNNKTSRIKLAVPSDFGGSFNIQSSAGNITLAGFPEATLNAEADAGEIKIGEIKNVNADCDAGNIKIDKINNRADISADAGNINIGTADIKESSKIECDFGNVTVNEISEVKVNAKCSLGKCTVNKSNDGAAIELTVEADCGNIDVG